MKSIKIFAAALFILSTISSCKKDGTNVPDSPDGTPLPGNPVNGVLTGTIYSPNGAVTLASVIVETVIANGSKKSDTTDKDGKFELELPAGEYQLKMYSGAGERFSAQGSFTVHAGKTAVIPSTQTRLSFSTRIAYVHGEFDAIQTLLSEMGISATPLTLDDMQDYNILKEYDVLLLNCGSGYIDFEDNKLIDRFLKEGNSVYASDFEIRAISRQDWGFIPQNFISYNLDGVAGITEGIVLFEPFKKALGKNTITIEYDMPMYVRITDYNSSDPRFKVLVDHPQKGPLAMNIQWGQSRLSSQGNAYGGNIIYTTFHDASLSKDVKTVLQQMILQL